MTSERAAVAILMVFVFCVVATLWTGVSFALWGNLDTANQILRILPLWLGGFLLAALNLAIVLLREES